MEAKKYVIMCVGMTHSGKTTFARKLVEKHPKTVQLDSDEVAVFLREKYPLIVQSDYNKNQPKDKSIKVIAFKDIYTFSLNTGLNIILSNGNIAKNSRSFMSRHAKRHGYTLITVYFNLPEEVMQKRLEKTTKSKDVFIYSKTWTEVFEWQKDYAELPPSKKNTIYFEIKNDAGQDKVMEEISKLL